MLYFSTLELTFYAVPPHKLLVFSVSLLNLYKDSSLYWVSRYTCNNKSVWFYVFFWFHSPGHCQHIQNYLWVTQMEAFTSVCWSGNPHVPCASTFFFLFPFLVLSNQKITCQLNRFASIVICLSFLFLFYQLSVSVGVALFFICLFFTAHANYPARLLFISNKPEKYNTSLPVWRRIFSWKTSLTLRV